MKYKRINWGGYENKHGVRFTKREVEELRVLVQRVRVKRRYYGDKFKGAQQDREAVGDPVIFRPRQPSQDINRFRNKGDFRAYMQRMRDTGSRTFIKNELSMYKENLIMAVKKAYAIPAPTEAYALIDNIESLSPTQFQHLVVKYARHWSFFWWYKYPSMDKLKQAMREVEQIKQETT